MTRRRWCCNEYSVKTVNKAITVHYVLLLHLIKLTGQRKCDSLSKVKSENGMSYFRIKTETLNSFSVKSKQKEKFRNISPCIFVKWFIKKKVYPF